MLTKSLSALVVASLYACVPTTHAGIFTYLAVPSSPTVLANGSLTVQVYLQETLASPSDTAVLSEPGSGLYSAAFQLDRTSGPALPVQIAGLSANVLDYLGHESQTDVFNFPWSVAVDSAVSSQSSGNSYTITSNPTSAGLVESIDFDRDLINAGTLGTPVGDLYQLYLGTLSLHAGSDTGTTSFTLSSGLFNQDTTSVLLDGDSNHIVLPVASTSFDVTVIPAPEPASLSLAALGVCGLLWKRRSLSPR